jgi:hypothetical protein
LALSFNQAVTVPENVMFRELEDEAVILNVDTDRYFGLDDVGTRFWKELTTSGSIQAAFDKLVAEYDAEPELLRRDLIGLIEKLVAQGLLTISDN